MRFLLLSFILVILTASCSQRTKEAVYNMTHERERQEYLQQGRSDCPRTDHFDNYNKQRDEVIK